MDFSKQVHIFSKSVRFRVLLRSTVKLRAGACQSDRLRHALSRKSRLEVRGTPEEQFVPVSVTICCQGHFDLITRG